jgi:quinoprotein glucose dehydrogenase
MHSTLHTRVARIGLLTLVVGALSLPLFGQSMDPISAGTKNGEWPTYGGDLASRRYSPLDQVNATNFAKLEVAWRFKTENLGPTPEFQFQSTPLMVNGTLYFTVDAPRRRGRGPRRAK